MSKNKQLPPMSKEEEKKHWNTFFEKLPEESYLRELFKNLEHIVESEINSDFARNIAKELLAARANDQSDYIRELEIKNKFLKEQNTAIRNQFAAASRDKEEYRKTSELREKEILRLQHKNRNIRASIRHLIEFVNEEE